MPGQEPIGAYEHTTEERFQYGCAHAAIFHALALISSTLAFLELIDLLSNIFGFFVVTYPYISQLATSLVSFLLLSFYSLTMSSAYPNCIFSIIGDWGVCGHRTHPNFPLFIEMIPQILVSPVRV
jgi:hypothetical protein